MADRVRASSRRVTLSDVARLAGCSTAAVSLWVNGKAEGRLTPENAERIEAAVKALGYLPNRTAQGLASGTSKSVAFLFPGALYGFFFGHIVDGVGRSLGDDWDLAFFDAKRSNEHPGQPTIVERALATNPAALLVASPSAAVLEAVQSAPVPTVVIDAPDADPHVSLVSFDLRSSIGNMVDDLARLGHRNTAYITFLGESMSLASRRTQVRERLQEVGIAMVDTDLELDALEIAETAAAFGTIWPLWRDQGVTAVICADDRHAYGVIAAARVLGIRIPGDLAVVGFNDLEPAALLDPSLSAISLQADAIGEAAGSLLGEQFRTGEPSRRLVPTRYVRRQSTGDQPR